MHALTMTAAAALLAVVVILGAPRLSRRLVFKPEPGEHDFKEPVFPSDVSHEHLFFDTQDGNHLHGWLVRREGNHGLLLICHGNRGSIAGREDTAMFYLELGMDVCLFDYRGYGRSTGIPSEFGTYCDVDAAWSYLTKQRGYNACDIVLLGQSLGAAIASHLATHVTPRAIILESTFSSLPKLAGELYPLLKYPLTVLVKYNTLTKIPEFTAPLLLVHSTEDEFIGIHHGYELLNAAAPGTELVEITGRHHDGFFTSKSVYVPAIERFLGKQNQ